MWITVALLRKHMYKGFFGKNCNKMYGVKIIIYYLYYRPQPRYHTHLIDNFQDLDVDISEYDFGSPRPQTPIQSFFKSQSKTQVQRYQVKRWLFPIYCISFWYYSEEICIGIINDKCHEIIRLQECKESKVKRIPKIERKHHTIKQEIIRR